MICPRCEILPTGDGTLIFFPSRHRPSLPLTSVTLRVAPTVLDGVYYTPLGRLSMPDISSVGIVPVPQRSALETSPRELSEAYVLQYRHPLVVEQSSLETAPEGCDIHRRVR